MPREISVVVGASGGLGRALADVLSEQGEVFALSRRRPVGWPGAWAATDILQETTLANAAFAIRSIGQPARVIVATGQLHGPGFSPEKSMRALSLDTMTTLFAVNTAGPALVAKHLLPLLPRDAPHLFAVISARVGSIGDNHLGGWYSYRASKAALNMVIRTLAIEHRRTHTQGIVVALHPGTVDTGLSKPFQSGVPEGKLFTPAQSAAALLRVMDGLGPETNGGFYAWDGSAIPW